MSVSCESNERVLQALEATHAAEKLLRRTELIAGEEAGWHRVQGTNVWVCFCRGMGGQHAPHYVYMTGVQDMERDAALSLGCEAWGWRAP